MEKTREEMLAIIRKVIGKKTFDFSAAYINKHGCPNIGDGCGVCAITRKNVFFRYNVLVRYYYDEETDTYPARIKKAPIFGRIDGFIKGSVKMDDLSTNDLTSLYNGFTYYLYWENGVRMPELKKQYTECEAKAKMYKKLTELV